MCGRYTLGAPDDDLADLLDLPETPSLEPRYNIAPTQPVPVVRLMPAGEVRELQMLHWGLIPSWSKDPAMGARMINARSETAAEKPAFRTAMRQRRCLIPADGFYEWQRTAGRKQPHYIRKRDRAPFAFAGLWEHWEGPEGAVIESCTILTTTPNDLLRPLHDRMPVILEPSDYALWLDAAVNDASRVQPLLRPYQPDDLIAHPVGTHVNSPRNEDPRCTEPLE
ncbi:MAG TPA: SOS response-associated peptidase [Phycisphaerae bacterium]|nr:SOS response-associated peptidase [Phycisphaerae bacterium]